LIFREGRDSGLPLSYEKAVKILDGRGFGIKPDLSRIEALVELLDYPERNYPSIQIAGTNGKSTTARMIGAILAAHGITTGVYLSPHLQSVRERFVLAGPAEEGVASDYIGKEEFAQLIEYLLPYVEEVENKLGEQVTYYELTTAAAFEWMSDKSVGAAVLETGMGGTWDAATVADPSVAVLTHIDVDHAEFLGSTPLENAREKVGIIEDGARVVSASQQPDVLDLIKKTVAEREAELKLYSKDFELIQNEPAVAGRHISVRGTCATYGDIFVGLIGAHQGVNAAVAIAGSEEFLGRELDPEALRIAFASVSSPGRMEVVRRRPLVVLDGAHNPHGAGTLGPSLVEAFGKRRTTFVISIFKDKDIGGILKQLVPYADEIIFTTASHPRSAEPEELATRARTLGHEVVTTAPSLPEAIDSAFEAAHADDLVVVTGSIWSIGIARDHLVGPVD
jgi:dihydrofolate synthase/folylpolyglutamate synthase